MYSALFAFLIHLKALVERCGVIAKKAEILWRRRLLSILDGASLSLYFVNAVDVARTDYKIYLKISAFPFPNSDSYTVSTIPATSSSDHHLLQTPKRTLNTPLTIQKINVFTADPHKITLPLAFPLSPPFPLLPSLNLSFAPSPSPPRLIHRQSKQISQSFPSKTTYPT